MNKESIASIRVLARKFWVLCIVFLLASSAVLATVSPKAFALNSPITRVSTDSSGDEGDSGSYYSDMSADGRYVVFESDATNLVASDTNGVSDIFLKDRQTGITTRVSTDSSGNEADSYSFLPKISADGRYVVFDSGATDLVASDTNGVNDTFRKDIQSGTTIRLSTDSSGNEANDDSYTADISDDGRYVVFQSDATDLVAGDTNSAMDVFLKDIQTGTTTRVSTDSSGNQSAGDPWYEPRISPDGRFVGFSSAATDLVASDTNGVEDVFIKNIQSGTTTRVSTDSSGNQADNASYSIVFSQDGRYVTFASAATDLVASDTNGQQDVFMKDTQSGTTTRVSTDSSGNESDSASYEPSITHDGKLVAFHSSATNLVSGDTNSGTDVFIKDIQSGTTTRVSTTSSGGQGTGSTSNSVPVISADGRYVSFTYDGTNLVANDTNSTYDVFVKELNPPSSYGNNPVGRSLTISSSGISDANVDYTFTFTLPDSSPIQSIRIRFCTNASTGTCTKPTGFDVSAYTVSGQSFSEATSFTSQTSNEAQCTVATGSNDENEVCLERTDVDPETATQKTFTLSGVTNPSVATTIYARITLYGNNDFNAAGRIYDGAVAAAIVNILTIQARVQENLQFCVGTTTVNNGTTNPGNECSDVSGTTVDLGVVDTTTTGAVSPDADGNNVNGIAWLRTNANGGATIGYRAVQQSGTNHLGSLRATSASCNAGNVNNDQCFRSFATQTALSASTEQFGMTVEYVNTGSGGTTTSITRTTDYDGSSGGYAWDESGALAIIANASGAVDDEALILKFAAVSAITTPTGSYQAQAKFFATPTF